MKRGADPYGKEAKSSARSSTPGVDDAVDAMQKRGLFERVADFLFGFDFFISYCWADGRHYATELQRKLEEQGFN
ncbi:MAG: hypothetical protein WCF18_23535, partial [Chthoniobacteraceae bacterium]